MKTHINLLHSEFKPKFELVCGANLMGLVFLVSLLCIVAYASLVYMQGNIDGLAAEKKANIEVQQQRIQALTESLTGRKTDASLDAKLAILMTQNQEKSKLLTNVKQLSSLQQRSFSNMFDDLSKAHSTDLWLEYFTISPGTLSFNGKLQTPNALPKWIDKLSDTNFFKGQTFNLAQVIREENGLNFELTSTPAKPTKDAEKQKPEEAVYE